MVIVGLRVDRQAITVIGRLSLADINHELARRLPHLLRRLTAALMSVSSILDVGTADQPDIASLAALVSFRTTSTALCSESILIIPGILVILCDNYASVLLVVSAREHTTSYQGWLSVLLGHGSISTRTNFHD